ncbi:MAG: hypothetical protein ABS75_12160 [Pelagibacterium sp. SCN 63-23]|nr:MAG: hypothetical protein ABS75_12160 [Pelagibacterium sp. SCN 63-23]
MMNDVFAGHLPAGREAARSGIVAGLGLRHGASADELVRLIDLTLAECRYERTDLAALATLAHKQAHPALQAVAAQLGVPLLGLPENDLRHGVPNPSERVAQHIDLPSVAEASALAFGPLLVEKRRSANATCALSLWTGPYSAPISSAMTAASIVSTSSAGP